MFSPPWGSTASVPFELPFLAEEAQETTPTPTGAALEEDGTAWLEEDGTVVSTE